LDWLNIPNPTDDHNAEELWNDAQSYWTHVMGGSKGGINYGKISVSLGN
jgi:hypothetical protein